MLQAWILFVICSVVFVVVSLLTPPPTPGVRRPVLLAQSLWPSLTEGRIEGSRIPRVLAALLVLVMVACYSVFA